MADEDRGAIRFAEKLLTLLDQGGFTATYKYGVLLGLLELCLERSARDGAAPDFVTTRQLAEKIVELYWPHTLAFRPRDELVLRQNRGGQATEQSSHVGLTLSTTHRRLDLRPSARRKIGSITPATLQRRPLMFGISLGIPHRKPILATKRHHDPDQDRPNKVAGRRFGQCHGQAATKLAREHARSLTCRPLVYKGIQDCQPRA